MVSVTDSIVLTILNSVFLLPITKEVCVCWGRSRGGSGGSGGSVEPPKLT